MGARVLVCVQRLCDRVRRCAGDHAPQVGGSPPLLGHPRQSSRGAAKTPHLALPPGEITLWHTCKNNLLATTRLGRPWSTHFLPTPAHKLPRGAASARRSSLLKEIGRQSTSTRISSPVEESKSGTQSLRRRRGRRGGGTEGG